MAHLRVFAVKVDKSSILNTYELVVPWSFYDKHMVDDYATYGTVYLKGYAFSWPVKVKRIPGEGWVELRKGWSDFLEHVIQEESTAYLVIEYEPDMCFTVRAFYSDNNIVLDIPSDKRHIPEGAFLGWEGPGPEYLLKVSSDSDKAMINAHGPFHRTVLVEGVGTFSFILKSMPAVRVEIEVSLSKRNYLEFGKGWKTFLKASLIMPDDLVHLGAVPGQRSIIVMSFRWEVLGTCGTKKGDNGATLTPLPTLANHPSSSSDNFCLNIG